jgi:hypothetical protein
MVQRGYTTNRNKNARTMIIANTVTGSAKNFLRSSCLLLELAKIQHLIPWLIAIYPCEKSFILYRFITGIDPGKIQFGKGEKIPLSNNLMDGQKPPEGGLCK